MFRTVLISVITIIHIYVFCRAATVPFIRTYVPLKILIGVGLILWASFFLGRAFGREEESWFALIMEMIGMNWMAILFLIFVLVLLADILTVFGFLFSGIAPKIRGLAIIAGILLSIIALFQGLRPPVTKDYEVGFKDLPHEMDGKVIVALSDLHIGSLIGEKWLRARVEQIKNLDPDLVFFLGDIFEGHGTSLYEMLPALSEIKSPMGLWAVTGNHEFHGDPDENMGVLKKAGFRILHDEWVQVIPGFILAGVDDLTSRRRSRMGNDTVGKALKERPSGVTVFLSHTPWEVNKAADLGVGLMLCGHTHGGQIWPFGYLVRLSYPFMGGKYDINGMTLIVNRGAGTWGPRMRLWHAGEIVRVTLRKEATRK